MIFTTNKSLDAWGEVLHDDANQPFIKTWAYTDIAWDMVTRQLVDDAMANDGGLEFRNVETRDEWVDAKTRRITHETPVGRLAEAIHYDEWDLSAYHSEYRLKTPEDFKVYEYMLQNEVWWWDQAAYEAQIAAAGGRGFTSCSIRRRACASGRSPGASSPCWGPTSSSSRRWPPTRRRAGSTSAAW